MYATLNGKNTFLGRYPSLLDAASARKSFERRNGYHPNHGNKTGAKAVNPHELLTIRSLRNVVDQPDEFASAPTAFREGCTP
ncbi:hypothetical protein D3C84_765080 [compost metagenome]